MKPRLVLGVVGGVLLLGVVHVGVNVGFGRFVDDVEGFFRDERKHLVVGYLPVTCHLTCPVLNWTTEHADSGSLFQSKKYNEFASMSEDLSQANLAAAFLNVPLAISLKQKGVPIRVVTLGHRDGTAIVVRTESDIHTFADLRDKRFLIPSKFSNQQLWLARLCKENGMQLSDIDFLECPPPDMPMMLETGQCDAYCVGEPHCARAEIAGTGRVLLQVKDSWPNFISCVLVVREDVIAQDRDLIQELVHGIHGSGMWLEEGIDNRYRAADIVGKYYYNQKPELLRHVLSKPIDRVRYDQLTPVEDELDTIVRLGVEVGMFPSFMAFDDYVDSSFTLDPVLQALPMPPDDGSPVAEGGTASPVQGTMQR